MAQAVTPLNRDPQLDALKLPPHSLEAEQSVLGGLLLDNEAWEKIGDVLRAQGYLPAALDAYKASRAMAERLANSAPGNEGWQRDLSVSDGRIGDVLLAQGERAEALAAFRKSLGIRETLAAQRAAGIQPFILDIASGPGTYLVEALAEDARHDVRRHQHTQGHHHPALKETDPSFGHRRQGGTWRGGKQTAFIDLTDKCLRAPGWRFGQKPAFHFDLSR